MFILYMLLFVAGLYLLGFAFTLTSFQALVFLAGLALVMVAIALCIHLPFARERHHG